MVCEYDYDENTMKIRVKCLGCLYGSSIEDFPMCMATLINKLIETKKVNSVVLVRDREYEYDYEQVKMLMEIAKIVEDVGRGDIPVQSLPRAQLSRCYPEWETHLNYMVYDLLPKDPIGTYVKIKRELRRVGVKMKKLQSDVYTSALKEYKRVLETLLDRLGNTKLLRLARPDTFGYHIGSREIYRQIFMPSVRPNFMFTRYLTTPPKGAESVDRYMVGDAQIEIFRVPKTTQNLYFVLPPEFRLSEEKYMVLDAARRYMAAHKPTTEEFVRSQRIREIFFNIGKDVIRDMAGRSGLKLSGKEIKQLSTILTRYTAGYGVLEILLADERLQDLYINSPIESQPVLVFHQDWEECKTNLIPTREDAEAWATRLRIQSGRPLDEANPVLDVDIAVPGGKARFAVITNTLSPKGLGFAIRRHRFKPWTLPLFIKAGMLTPLAAGLLSFLIDGSASVLVAGGRSSGKTSVLSSLMLELLPKTRQIVIEDTLELPVEELTKLGYNIESLKSRSVITRVETEMPADEALRTSLRLGDSAMIVGEIRSSIRGNEEVVIIENGETRRVPIKELEGKSLKNIYVPTLDKNNKVKLTKLTDFVKHPKREKLLEITTKTGRKVTVTEDHSVFTATDFKVHPIETGKLGPGDKILIPASMPSGYNDVDWLDLTELLPGLRLEGAEKYIRKAIRKIGWRKASKICNVRDIYVYVSWGKYKTRIPIKRFKRLMKEAGVRYSLKDLRIKNVTSNTLPASLKVDKDFCRFLGYYAAEGYYSDTHGIIITNSNQKVIKDVTSISKKLFGIKPGIREVKGLGKSKQMRVTSSPLKNLIAKLGCGRICGEKRIPPIIYGLSEERICAFLKWMYSCDGSFTRSKSSGNTIKYTTTSEKLAEDVLYLLLTLGIVGRVYKKHPKTRGRKVLYSVEFKQREFIKTFLEKVGFTHKKTLPLKRAVAHSPDNSIHFDVEELEKHLKLPRKYRHLRRYGQCSKNYLKKLSEETECSQQFSDFVNGDFYMDEIKAIDEVKLETPEPVYDLSVNPTENFIGGFGGIILHNTEAKALWEAMRIGALSNVVAGTIHGESAYGVFDRVVNDLGVPLASFKATDIIPICKMLRSADGLHRYRRITEITEVRKKWSTDPIKEGAFVNLMEYSGREDVLKPADTLVNGESEVLNRIASFVKEWSGNWEAVWENIKLRGKIKQTMVDYAEKVNRPELMEAHWVTRSNGQLHLIEELVKSEVGASDPKRIHSMWLDWFKAAVK